MKVVAFSLVQDFTTFIFSIKTLNHLIMINRLFYNFHPGNFAQIFKTNIMRRKFNLLTAFFIMLTLLGKAQETTSEIQGTVSDNTTSLAGATITALHQPTGTKYVTTTRKDGRYNLANLRIGGPYEVTVSYVGFKEEKQDNVNLLLGQEFK